MLKRTSPLLLVVLSLVIAVIALAYSYYDVKEIDGVVHDANGNPIAAAAITLAGRSTISDKDGRFHLAVSRGKYDLIGFADGFDSAQQPLAAEDFFKKNFSADLTLPLNQFRGSVSATDTHQPLAGATVRMDNGATVTTDARGEFVVRGIKSGAKLTASAPGYNGGTLVFQANGARDLQLSPALTRVSVTDQYTNAPLSNVTVSIGEQSAQTDAQGQVVFRALSAGGSLGAQAPGYESVQLSYNGEAGLTLALRPNTLDGTVLDATTKKPIAQALILYNGKMIETDARGAYHLDAAPAELTLSVKTPGYRLTSFNLKRASHFDLPLQPFAAKAIHLYFGISHEEVITLLDRLRGTEVTAVVMDVKEGPGEIVWDSQVPLAKEIGAYQEFGISPKDLIEQCRARQLYCIAREVVFKDSRLATAHPDRALHYPGGGLLNDSTAIWLNPAKRENWDYVLALAKELSAMGFDEIQFDYIRYPGIPTPAASEFGTAESRVETIKTFLATASQTLKPLPVFFSGDVFGLTTATDDENGIGQRLEADAPSFDYVSPMMYPSTWKGAESLFQVGLGVSSCRNPLSCPYEIIFEGTRHAQQRVKTLIRPWLQAYEDGNFGVPQYIMQKKGADDSKSAGWLFWNNQGIYDLATFSRKQ